MFDESLENITSFISKLISVFNSSDFSFEILVGFTHSLDLSEKRRIVNLRDSRVRFIFEDFEQKRPPSQRIIQTKNYLLRKATGKYSIILNSDDSLRKPIDEALQFLEEHKEFFAYAYNFTQNTSSGKSCQNHPISYKSIVLDIDTYVYQNHRLNSSCIVFRTDAAIKKLETELLLHEQIFPQFCLSIGKLLYSPKILLTKCEFSSYDAKKVLETIAFLEFSNKHVFSKNRHILLNYCKILSSIDSATIQSSHLTGTSIEIFNYLNLQSGTSSLPLSNWILKNSKLCQILLKTKPFFAFLLRVFFVVHWFYIHKKMHAYKIYYWSNKPNFGDALSRYIVEKMIKYTDHESAHISMVHVPRFWPNKVISIGSILDLLTLFTKTIYWGTGCLGPHRFQVKGQGIIRTIYRNIPQGFWNKLRAVINRGTIFAVRGPYTRNLLIKSGVACPEIYGDPALLLPFFYNPNSKTKTNFATNQKEKPIGVILHHNHTDYSPAASKKLNGFKFISIDRYSDDELEEFIDEVLTCSKIFSSSLHGIIVAQAYGIPAQWIKFINKPIHFEDDFKFHDYFLGANQTDQQPVVLNDILDLQELKNLQFSIPNNFMGKEKLMSSFPRDIIKAKCRF